MLFSEKFPQPFWRGKDAALYLGDARACLRAMPTRSVHCVVTSPPYWNLRDYGTGDAQIGLEERADCAGWATGLACGECYVCNLVHVFAEVRRVLRDDGTCWLNLGDTFLPTGNLVGIPWRVALALQAHGWVLRQDIIWYAPNKMPDSAQDRCGKSHEHIFLLTKGTGYYFDALAIAEEGKNSEDGLVNKRDTWIVPVQGYSGAHFATFSPRLIEPCILAGTSEYGVCAECLTPYERIVVKSGGESNERREALDNLSRDRSFDWSRNGKPGSGSTLDGRIPRKDTIGWKHMCGCSTTEVKPGIVLDQFVGSGTTVATSLLLGRAAIGIDVSEAYLREHAIPRIEAAQRGEKVRKKVAPVISTYMLPAPRKLRG